MKHIFKEQTGLTLNAFAGGIGMKHATLHNQFHGKRDLSLETVINTLANYGELSAEWLLRGRGSMYGVDVSTSGQIDNEVLALRSELNGVYKTLQLLGISLQPQQKKAAV